MNGHVALVIRDKDNRILFIKRSMNKKSLPGIWAFPSGTVEENESIKETTLREAKEELGINIEFEKIISIKNLEEFSVKLLFVLCKTNNSNFIIDFNEIEETKYLKFHEFFDNFSDEQIVHGLIWLRKNPLIWDNIK